MLTKPALEALTDQAFAVTADTRQAQAEVVITDAGRLAEIIGEHFRGNGAIAARVVMAVAVALPRLLAEYGDWPGGLELVPSVLALAAEQVAREAAAS
jgi:hypothetical protein